MFLLYYALNALNAHDAPQRLLLSKLIDSNNESRPQRLVHKTQLQRWVYLHVHIFKLLPQVSEGWGGGFSLVLQQHWTGKDDAQEIKIFLAATHIENESRGQGINCFFRGTAN